MRSLGFDAGGIYYPEALAVDTNGSGWPILETPRLRI